MKPCHSVAFQRLLAFVATIVCWYFSGSREALGVVMLAPGTNLPGQAYINAGAQLTGSVVAIKRVSFTTGAITYTSGVQINPLTVLTAAHVMDSLSGFRPASHIFVIGGSNFNSPDFEVGVSHYRTHPTYVQGSGVGTGQQVDLAVLTLTSPIVGRGVDFGQPPVINQGLSLAGYGRPGLSDFVLSSQDGFLRGFGGYFLSPTSQFDDSLYGSTFASGTVAGVGSEFDSGGGVFLDGRLVGIITAAATGSQRTTFLEVTNPDVRSWINANIDPKSLPQIQCTTTSSGCLIVFANLIYGRSYRIMRSHDLSANNWEEAYRFTPMATSSPWTEPLSSVGRMFYRLEWNE